MGAAACLSIWYVSEARNRWFRPDARGTAHVAPRWVSDLFMSAAPLYAAVTSLLLFPLTAFFKVGAAMACALAAAALAVYRRSSKHHDQVFTAGSPPLCVNSVYVIPAVHP